MELDALLQEEGQIRSEIARIQEAQRRMVFASLASSGGILSLVTVTAAIFKEDSQFVVDIAVPLTMGLSLIFTMVFVVYIGANFGILRLSQYCIDVLYPHINQVIGLRDRKVFQWEQYLRENKRKNLFDWATIALYAAGEAGSLLVIILLYQTAWIFLLSYSGQSFEAYHWLFLFFVLLLLVVITLLGARVVLLASKSGEKNQSDPNKSIQPTADASAD